MGNASLFAGYSEVRDFSWRKMLYKICHIDERVFEKQCLPKVSIVTPSYNQSQFLEATILSVLAQDYPNIEYIIIDGGSTDGSVEIIKKHADRLAYWASEPDKGQSHAINKGFTQSTGEIFYWLNSDDLLMPSAVKIAVACLLSNPDIGMIYGDRIVIDGKDNVLCMEEHPSFSKRWMKYNLKIPQETAFFRRDLFHEVGGINETLHCCMDYDLWIRMSQIAKIHHIPFVLGAYRNHQDAKSTDVSNMRAEIKTVTVRNFGSCRKRMVKKLFEKLEDVHLRWEKKTKARTIDINRVKLLIKTESSNITKINRFSN